MVEAGHGGVEAVRNDCGMGDPCAGVAGSGHVEVEGTTYQEGGMSLDANSWDAFERSTCATEGVGLTSVLGSTEEDHPQRRTFGRKVSYHGVAWHIRCTSPHWVGVEGKDVRESALGKDEDH